ncbi:MAG: 3D domain-containing protein [Planctomycetota bacterium]|jgi:3D (Asp-Asp-Asp) domain-containing protein
MQFRRIILMLGLMAMILVCVLLVTDTTSTQQASLQTNEAPAPGLTPILMSAVAHAAPAAAPPAETAALRVPEAPFFPSPIVPSPAGREETATQSLDDSATLDPRAYKVRAYVTGYCPCSRCCGRFANGRTSTRTSAWRPGIAVDPKAIAYGSRIDVPGYGMAIADDTGIAMRRNWQNRGVIHLDLRFTYHWQARRWGTKNLTVTVTPRPSSNQILAGRR